MAKKNEPLPLPLPAAPSVQIVGGTESERKFLAAVVGDALRDASISPFFSPGQTAWENSRAYQGRRDSLLDFMREESPRLFDKGVMVFEKSGPLFEDYSQSYTDPRVVGKAISSDVETAESAMLIHTLHDKLSEFGFSDISISAIAPTGAKVGTF